MNEDIKNHIDQIFKLQSNNEEIRKEGDQYFQNLLTTNCPELLRLSCSIILGNFEKPEGAVIMSFIFINRCSIFLQNNWSKFNIEQQDILRNSAVWGLTSPNPSIRSLSAYSFCLIAKCGFERYSDQILNQLSIPICNTEFPPICTLGSFMALKELCLHRVINQKMPFYQPSTMKIVLAFNTIMDNPKIFDIPNFIEFLNCYSVIFPFIQPYYMSSEENTMNFLLKLQKVYQFDIENIHIAGFNLLLSFIKCFYNHLNENIMREVVTILQNSFRRSETPEFIDPCINFLNDVALFEADIWSKNGSTKEVISTLAPSIVEPMMLLITKYAPKKVFRSLEEENIEEQNSISVCRDAIECLKNFSSLTPCVLKFIEETFESRIHSCSQNGILAAIYSFYCVSKDELSCRQFTSDDPISASLNMFYENKFDIIIELTRSPNEVVSHEAFSILPVIFKTSFCISTSQAFLKKILSTFNAIMHWMKEKLASREPISDVIPSKICDVLLEISKKNRKCVPFDASEFVFEEDETTESEDKFKILGHEHPNSAFSLYFFKYLRSLFTILLFPSFQSKSSFELQARCSESIYSMFKSTPEEQIPFVMNHYIPIIFDLIRTQFEAPQANEMNDKIEAPTLICNYCIILTGIIEAAGSAAIPHSQNLMNFLIKLLLVKSISIHYEALNAMTYLVMAIGKEIAPYYGKLIEIIFLSLESMNSGIIEKCAKFAFAVFSAMSFDPSFFDQSMLKSLFEAFRKIILNLNIFLKARLELIANFGRILCVLKTTAEPFLPIYGQILSHYSKMPLNLLSENDATVASELYFVIINGYRNLLNVTLGTQFINVYNDNFREIVKFISYISKLENVFDLDLKFAVLGFLGDLVNNQDNLGRRMINLLHSRLILDVLYLLENDQNIRLSNDAQIIYENLSKK